MFVYAVSVFLPVSVRVVIQKSNVLHITCHLFLKCYVLFHFLSLFCYTTHYITVVLMLSEMHCHVVAS